MSCNEYLKPRDTSDGFLRRLLFVKFPVKFCDDPNPKKNERKIDRTLESKFAKPEYLSGIMNWIISGYRQLKAVGEFTQPTDTANILEEFTALTNPIIDFLTEFVMPTDDRGFRRITTANLYQHYVAWCGNSGHRATSKRKFGMEVIKLLPDYRPDIFPYRTSNERGYELAITN
jgi:phage/plasmid-associated DNA primase